MKEAHRIAGLALGWGLGAAVLGCAATAVEPNDSGSDANPPDVVVSDAPVDAAAADVVTDASSADGSASSFAWFPGNYVLLGQADNATTERDAVLGSSNMASFVGIEKRYDWVASEGSQGDYSAGVADIEADLAAVDAVNKKLIVFLTYKAFSTTHVVPSYMLASGPWCVGSICGEVAMSNGTTAMIWQTGVADRLHAWLSGLASKILVSPHASALAGIVFPESACSGCDATNTSYTAATYLAALEGNASAAVAAFPNVIAFQYINFFPPNNMASQYLGMFADFALANPHVGLGCPDLAPLFDPPEYPILESAKYEGRVPMAPAVESPDYASGRASPDGGVAATYELGINPSTKGGMSAQIISWSNVNGSGNVFTIDDVAAYVSAHPNPNTTAPTW